MFTKTKLHITFILSLILFGAIVEYFAVGVFKTSFIEQRKVFGRAILKSIQNDINFAISISNKDYFDKTVNNIVTIKFIDSFNVYKADRLIFSKIIRRNSPVVISQIDLLPINNKLIEVKYEIGLNLSDFKISQKKFIESTLLIILILIVFIYTVITFIINRFLSPINHLVEAVRKLKAGKYKKINIKGSKELELLIDTYNNFVVNLKTKDEQLQSKIKELNEKIIEIQALQKIVINVEKLASIGTMAAGMAHEINNPLAGIKGIAEVLLYIEEIGDNNTKKSLKDIISNCDRIAEIIKKLKGFSKITDEKQYIMIKDLINDAVDILKQSKKIDRHEQLAGNFNVSNAKIFCNRNEIIQVFLNLIENSYDAIEKDCQITIDVFEFDEKIEILYKDNGKGIDETIKDKIFDPFFTTKREKGTGLGLFICHKIISTNNGEIILLESDKGACFKITFFKKGDTNAQKNIGG